MSNKLIALASSLLLLGCCLAPGSAVAAPVDAFTGAWASPDSDGDLVRFEISAPSANGERVVQGFDPAADVCDRGPATAHGVGSVTGDTLVVVLTVRCHGTVGFVGTFTFTASAGTLVSNTSPAPYTRLGSG